MAKTTCSVCNRGPQRANRVSHSKIKTPRRQKVNILTRKINGTKTAVCARCVRTLSKIH